MIYFVPMNEQYAEPIPVTGEVMSLARILWDYHHMGHAMEKCDCIFALGSHDLRVANRAAELWLGGWAPYIIFSGGLGRLTLGMWQQAEADQFAAIAVKMGVPEEKILIENKSANSGENVLFTQQLLQNKGLDPQKFLLVQKPYMERRAYATVKKWWPDKKLIVTSPQFTFENYANDDIPLERVIHIMVGDLQRIKIYPSMGFQINQEIPDQVWDAYEHLVALGFRSHLIPLKSDNQFG
jgi:uncharacterized SAM-binding protein YcdF (DUF218 family)